MSGTRESDAFESTLRPGPARVGGEIMSASTLMGLGLTHLSPVELDEEESAAAPMASAPGEQTQATIEPGRATVLPRRAGTVASPGASEARARFQHVRLLGEGGMGQVELARDNDIRRTVAVKRIKVEARSEQALLRFADEVRIVGQLEHPAIVPIYDVGRDPDGQLYLVMKHLNGETMEQILERLRAKDPAYVERFPVHQRAHIYLAVLDAMRYAHARGIIHRDLKPSNIMIGPYGEVTVLDWGIAKQIRQRAATNVVHPLETTAPGSHEGRLETQLGALAGTPLYMSPEQAAGRNDELDERSDVYTLALILLEWLSLENPRRGKTTLTELLAAIISTDLGPETGKAALIAGVPAYYIKIILDGLVRDPVKRLASVAELERRLSAAIEGKVPIECHVTLARRAAHEVICWIDRHPIAYTLLFFGAGLGLLIALTFGLYRALT